MDLTKLNEAIDKMFDYGPLRKKPSKKADDKSPANKPKKGVSEAIDSKGQR